MRYVYKNQFYKLPASIIDALGSIIFFPSRMFIKPPPLYPKNILVVRLDHIGDFVCTSPVFKNLKKRFPQAKITTLVNSVSKDLAVRDPNIDSVVTISPFWLSRHKERGDIGPGIRECIRAVKAIRPERFDLGIEPRGDIVSILLMWLGGVKYRVGYGITGGGFLLNKVCRYDESKHIIDRNLALLEALDIPVSDRSAKVYFSEIDEGEVERLLREKGVRPNQSEIDALGQTPFFRAVVVHPFAGAKAKEWSQENFGKLIERLKQDGYRVLLVGSKDDEGIFENAIDLRGRLNLPQLACLIKRAGFFIGLDSGPANIAAALGVPAIVICSGTNVPQLWIPNNPNVIFVRKDTDCKPCGLKICMKEKHKCMESITVEEVINSMKKLS